MELDKGAAGWPGVATLTLASPGYRAKRVGRELGVVNVLRALQGTAEHAVISMR